MLGVGEITSAQFGLTFSHVQQILPDKIYAKLQLGNAQGEGQNLLLLLVISISVYSSGE